MGACRNGSARVFTANSRHARTGAVLTARETMVETMDHSRQAALPDSVSTGTGLDDSVQKFGPSNQPEAWNVAHF
jgi:hypothetical protein